MRVRVYACVGPTCVRVCVCACMRVFVCAIVCVRVFFGVRECAVDYDAFFVICMCRPNVIMSFKAH